MKRLKTLGSHVIILVLTFLSWSARAQETGFVVDEIIAKVDNYIVMKSDLERAYQDYITNGGSPDERVRCQYLAMLIRSKLMMAKAEIDSVVVLDSDVERVEDRYAGL